MLCLYVGCFATTVGLSYVLPGLHATNRQIQKRHTKQTHARTCAYTNMHTHAYTHRFCSGCHHGEPCRDYFAFPVSFLGWVHSTPPNTHTNVLSVFTCITEYMSYLHSCTGRLAHTDSLSARSAGSRAIALHHSSHPAVFQETASLMEPQRWGLRSLSPHVNQAGWRV